MEPVEYVLRWDTLRCSGCQRDGQCRWHEEGGILCKRCKRGGRVLLPQKWLVDPQVQRLVRADLTTLQGCLLGCRRGSCGLHVHISCDGVDQKDDMIFDIPK